MASKIMSKSSSVVRPLRAPVTSAGAHDAAHKEMLRVMIVMPARYTTDSMRKGRREPGSLLGMPVTHTLSQASGNEESWRHRFQSSASYW